MPVLPFRDEIDFTYHKKNKINANFNDNECWA
jgi:hypothetical protein